MAAASALQISHISLWPTLAGDTPGMEIVGNSSSLSKLKQGNSTQSPSSIFQPRFPSPFASISAGLGGLPGGVTQTFITEVSYWLIHGCYSCQVSLSLGREAPIEASVDTSDPGWTASTSCCFATGLAPWSSTLETYSAVFLQTLQLSGVPSPRTTCSLTDYGWAGPDDWFGGSEGTGAGLDRTSIIFSGTCRGSSQEETADLRQGVGGAATVTQDTQANLGV